MKNKSPNGHYPPGIPPGGRVIRPDSAQEALQRSMVEKLQPHLNELNQENASEERCTSLVFQAAIEKHGVEEVNGPLFDACAELALRLSKRNLTRAHEKAFELFAEKKVLPADLPPAIVRAAGRQGVTLAEPVSADVGTLVQDS